MEDMIKKDYSEILEEAEKPISNRNIIVNRRNNNISPRKYHMTGSEIIKKQERFEKLVVNISVDIKVMSGERFFNPFREAGIYFGCVQGLYLLGSNKWHEQVLVINKISEIMDNIKDKHGKSSWQKFSSRLPREKGGKTALTAKDDIGRIHQNYRVIQRLGGLNPCGYKLKQLNSCIDIKRIKDGRWCYRLNTNSISPIFDISEYSKFKMVKREVEVVNIVKDEEVIDSGVNI